MTDQYDDGYHDGYIDGQQRISYETDELNYTLKEYILVAECLDDLYVRECKKTKELTEQLELMKGWEKIAQSNGEDKRKYLKRIDDAIKYIEEYYGCVELSNITDILTG